MNDLRVQSWANMNDKPDKELKAEIEQTKRLASLAHDPTTTERLKALLEELVRQLGNDKKH
jgi:hypothetical protein